MGLIVGLVVLAGSLAVCYRYGLPVAGSLWRSWRTRRSGRWTDAAGRLRDARGMFVRS